jgi:hypothetical protein
MGRATAAAACLGLAALGLAATGCGSSSPSAAPASTTTAATTTTARGPAGFAAYQSCLKAHGVTLPAFGGFRGRRPGTGTTPRRPPAPTATGERPPTVFRQLTAKQQAALAACRSKLPAGTFAGGRRFRGGGGGGTRNGNPAFAKYTTCLKQHGVEFGSTSSNPAAFRKAQAACAKLLPANPRAPMTTAGSS